MKLAKTLGELKSSGYAPRTIKEEMRGNLIRMLQSREELFPGIIGYDSTVIPGLVNAILSKHDFILLGLRGMQVEERAQEILNTLARLRGDFEKVQESFRVLGKHITNAQGAYGEGEKALAKLDAKLGQIEQPVLPPADQPKLT